MKKQKPIIILEKEPKPIQLKPRSRSKSSYGYMESKMFAARMVNQAQVFKPSHFRNFGPLTIPDHVTFSEMPDHPFWSKVEKHLDTSFADAMFTHLYSPLSERPYAPSLKLKVHLVQVYEKLSKRELEMRLMFDMAIRRFAGIPMTFKKCDIQEMDLGGTLLESQLLEACFIDVLLQARPHIPKRNGEKESAFDEWFERYANEERQSIHPRMYKALTGIVQHIKQTHPVLIRYALKAFPLEQWFERSTPPTTIQGKAEAISQLTIRAFTFLSWFETDSVSTLFWLWKDPQQQLRSLELQAALYQTLCPSAYIPANKELILV